PQKLEVRFQDARAATDAVHHAVSEALRPAPWLRHRGAPGEAADERALHALAAEAPADALDAPPPQGDGPYAARGEGDLGSVEAVLRAARERGQDDAGATFAFRSPATSSVPGGAAAPADPGRDAVPHGYFGSLRFVGQLARTYLLCEAPGGGLVVIDQHASHERVLFHRLREGRRERRLEVQPFLVPPVVSLPPAAARAIEAAVDELAGAGLEVEPFGGDAVAVKAAPAILGGTPMGPLLGDLAQQLAEAERQSAVGEAVEGLLATMACHAAVRANQDLNRDEARALLDGLDAIDFKARCPHGRPVVVELPLSELEKRVGRR
ncbi:MAG TPA: DNA mismatch repair protein MutL, partial [Anaeromyxobacteraceae bacterium]|nr:DNA mismatch repair protein MutL [Anaeromyxobacteraceae bacterium]